MLDQRELYAELARPSRRRLHHLLGSGPAPFFEVLIITTIIIIIIIIIREQSSRGPVDEMHFFKK